MYNNGNLDISDDFDRRWKSKKGFGGYTLREPCNNNTGNWYAKDFGDFAQQGMEILNKSETLPYVQGEYIIKPALRSKKMLVDFILNKNENEFPPELNI